VHKPSDVDRFRELLASGTATGFTGFITRRVGTVEFRPGSAAPAESAGAIQNLWVTATGRRWKLVFGVVSARGATAAEGPDLGTRRLTAVVSALGPAVQTPPDLPLDPAPLVPGTADPFDGVMVLGFMPATTCQQVFRVNGDPPGPVDELLRRIAAAGPGALAQLLRSPLAVPLGRVVFTDGSDTPVGGESDDVARAWRTAGVGAIRSVHVLTPRPAGSDPQADRTLIHTAQARAIARGTGAAQSEQVLTSAAPTYTAVVADAAPCTAVTLLVATTDRGIR
jgi:hypothetical protein